MCGLFGFSLTGANRVPDPAIAAGRHARDLLAHRGPDSAGESVAAGTYLGHRRLAVIDLSESGRQPMVSDDGDVAIAVNGEIYNYQRLRDALGPERFRSQSDSEVVLHGYRVWGLDGLLDALDGMYAFVIHDRAAEQVHLVRDRPGIKPLFYAVHGGICTWASELKAIEAFAADGGPTGDARLTTDETALYDFLTYGYVPAPKTRFREVRKLPPGCVATIDMTDAALTVTRYWQLPAPPATALDGPGGDAEAAGQQLLTLVERNVASQLVSDVPVGFFLSGGMDSTTVVAHAALGRDARTYAIGWDVASHDETGFAEMAASAFATRHTTRKLSDDDSAGLLERMVAWYDEPHADTSILPTYWVSRLARQDVTVVLTGDGGDELFGGYQWYARFQRLRRAQATFGVLARLAPVRALEAVWPIGGKLAERVRMLAEREPLGLYAALLGAASADTRKHYAEALGIPDDYDRLWAFRAWWRPELGPRRALQYLDFHTYLPDDILTKVDRASMSVSLEARVPFLSRDVMEFAFAQPESWLYADGQLKGGMKTAYRDHLPVEILTRSKKGFSIPLHRWRQATNARPDLLRQQILDRWRRAVA
jgi:asparagine synthase (glutamine-hydrolysing)